MLKSFVLYLRRSFDKRQPSYQAKIATFNEKKRTHLCLKISEAEQRLNLAISAQNNGSFFQRVKSAFCAWRAFNSVEAASEREQSWPEAIGEFVFLLTIVFVLRNFVFGLYHTPTGSAEPNILVGDRIIGIKYPYVFNKEKKIKHGDLVIFDDVTFKYDQTNVVNQFWQKYAGWFDVPLLGLTAGPQSWVKRVVGIPGDVVEGRIENGRTEVYVNGRRLDEPYLNPHPLVRLRREVGLFPESWGMPRWFTKRMSESPLVTYNPSFPYNNQPFYCFEDGEIAEPDFDGQPVLWKPRHPTYEDLFGPLIVPAGKLWCMGDNRRGSSDARAWGFVKIDSVFARASRILWSIDSNEAFWLIDIIKNPLEFWTKKVRWSRFGRSIQPFVKVYPT